MKILNILGLFLLTPLVAFAQTPTLALENIVGQLAEIVNGLIPLMISIAGLLFFWGMVKFIANIGNEDAKKEGKHLMIWGILAVVVMVSFWGIIGFVQNTLGLSETQPPVVTPGPL